MHQNAAQVPDAVVWWEGIEHLVRDRVTGGDEVREQFHPPRAIDDVLNLFGGVVVQQKRCDTRQLGGDVAVGSGQQCVHPRCGGARQTLCGSNEQIDASAAVADPVAAVARTCATDRPAILPDPDEWPGSGRSWRTTPGCAAAVGSRVRRQLRAAAWCEWRRRVRTPRMFAGADDVRGTFRIPDGPTRCLARRAACGRIRCTPPSAGPSSGNRSRYLPPGPATRASAVRRPHWTHSCSRPR